MPKTSKKAHIKSKKGSIVEILYKGKAVAKY